MKLGIIIAASGKGLRISSEVPKQFMFVAGKPLIQWTIQRCMSVTGLYQLVIVVPEDFRTQTLALIPSSRVPHINVVTGGRHRTDSVRNGLAVIEPACDYVAIHDGARPFIKPVDFERCVRAAVHHGSAVAAGPCTDTIKLEHRGFIVKTLDRTHVWFVQTPQVFTRTGISAACRKARRKHLTDDAQMFERMGKKVRIVNVGSYNRKITTREDFAYAELVLRNTGGQ
ncbi:MAG: 2-C-methyl-D-erythritol 4-phosphate cytidylyltransferase [Elusimicrobia bacterium]|nr:2-C-methyl-D-erythritol 4-phosphate cytidylyltransferase [Elusimicrobiota bacterium]MBD3411483.1 2-C-methyl-D-erythritol 4-phosphate cytidylyltransferase [Elusimicrobiota bacterium]